MKKPKVIKNVAVYRPLYDDVRMAEVVAESEEITTLVFEFGQFPGEFYTLDFLKSGGKCTNPKIGYRLYVEE